MPKVKSYNRPFEGAPFQVIINVDSGGQFSTRLPAPVAARLGFNVVTGKTLQGCESAYLKALEDYEKSSTNRETVILYDVQANTYILHPTEERLLHKSDSIHFCHGAAIAVAAMVFNEVQITQADGTIQYDYEEGHGYALNRCSVAKRSDFRIRVDDHPYEHRMPYSTEREQFFIKIAKAMDAVTLQLLQLSDRDKALAFADAGVLQIPQST